MELSSANEVYKSYYHPKVLEFEGSKESHSHQFDR